MKLHPLGRPYNKSPLGSPRWSFSWESDHQRGAYSDSWGQHLHGPTVRMTLRIRVEMLPDDIKIPSWTPDWRNVVLPLPSPQFQFTGRSSDWRKSVAIQRTSAEGDLWIDGPYYHQIKEALDRMLTSTASYDQRVGFAGTIVQREGLFELVPDELPSPAKIT